MGIKECINVKFSEGMGIFDNQCGYPVIDIKEDHCGQTGKVKDIQGIQAHAGRDFFFPEGKEFSLDIDECPYLHIAIKAEKNTKTCLFLMVHDKEPNDHKNRFVVIGKTPEGEPGIYDVIADSFTIENDSQWHEYDFDLRKIREKDDEYPYFPNAGSVSIIQFYSWTGSGEHIFHFNDLSFKQGAKPPTSESFIVRGMVVTNSGVAAKGLKIIAIDKSPGKDVLLEEAITDSFGNYTVSYNKEILTRRGKEKADIEIKIVDKDDESKIFGTSSVHYNAKKDEEINLVLKEESIDKISEYNQIMTELNPHIGKVLLKDLQENETRQDISYLANKTGWDARLVAMVSLADKYSAESGILPDLYYALFRAGVSTDADGLFQTNSGSVKKIWEKALEENIIESSLKSSFEKNLARFKEHGTMHLLEKASHVGVSSLKELLTISLPDDSKQKEFVELYYNQVGDMNSFWANAEEKFGKDTTDRLQIDGKLGYLTVNNAELINKLREDKKIENNPVDLIRNGLYKMETWEKLLSNGMQVPENIPGETPEKKKENYINYMVNLLKISYPTAVVAEMVHNDELPAKGGSGVKNEIYNFFKDTQDRFEIGIHPIEKFIKDNEMKIGDDALVELKKLQRIYQISPSEKALAGLWNNKFDSARSIIQYDEKKFIEKFSKDLGGEDIGKITYAKAHQVHSLVLNVAISNITSQISSKTYAISGTGTEKTAYSAIVAAPQMEELLGSLDYCACGHCRSVLSPAAYMVDLLKFINLKITDYPHGTKNPIDSLLERRPDIEHIQLTCENTEIVLPYIDLVNEILEYYVVHPDKNPPGDNVYDTLEDFKGYNIKDGITTAELLANPQFVNELAYTILEDQVYPCNLPFNRSLEALRLYYELLKVPLHEAMEILRVNDDFDVTEDTPYAWREIHHEFLGISKKEYEILTENGTTKLRSYFGEEDEDMTLDEFNSKFRNAKVFSRKTGITYDELIEIIKTRFINPESYLIPRLEKLRISFADIYDFNEGNITPEEFEEKIPSGLDLLIYGGDEKSWVIENYDEIMNLIVLTVPEGNKTDCGIVISELRYSLPDNENNSLLEMDYMRFIRFIRLKNKLGWTIEETDKTITALYRPDYGFGDLLVRIAHVKKVMEKLNLKKEKNLIKLLALWSNIDTQGNNSLYRQMFLQSSIIKMDNIFDENVYGEYLQEDAKIKDHLPPLQAAFNVTTDELALILNDAGFVDDSELSLENISKIYRYSFLAKALKISLEELITLKAMSGLDPFVELLYLDPDDNKKYKKPDALTFIELVQLIRKSDLKIKTLSYLLQHEDGTGKASPSMESILSLSKTLKDGLVRIEQELKVEDDPTGEVFKSKMALVYENVIVDRFFGILKGTTSYFVTYNNMLEPDLKEISDKITYDHFQKRLTFQGLMTETVKEKFENAASATDLFKAAIQDLHAQGQREFSAFFEKYPNLKELYDIYSTSQKPEDEKIGDILKDFLPSLKERLKRLFIKQTLSSLVNVDLTILNELLEKNDIMHSIEKDDKPAIEDFIKLESDGVSVHYFFADNTTSTPDITLSGIAFNRGIAARSKFSNNGLISTLLSEEIIKEVTHYTDYVYFNDSIKDESQLKARLVEQNIVSSEIENVLDIWEQSNNKLPSNPADENEKISAIWRFYLEIPSTGNYNFYIETDNGAEVTIYIDGNAVTTNSNSGIWQNQGPMELKAGRLYRVELEIDKVKDKAILKWESKGIAKESIPVKYLYLYEAIQNFSYIYIRLLKAISLLEGLKLGEKEIRFFSAETSFWINGKGFLNAIPAAKNPDQGQVTDFFNKFKDLLQYKELKGSLKIKDETLVNLLDVLKDLNVEAENKEDFLLKVTGWDKSSSDDLLTRFNWVQNDLSDFMKIYRVNKAFETVKKFGVPATQILEWTTNQPPAATVRGLQNTLRTKYDQSVWLDALKPINDKLRSRQRDAMVSYILHEMQKESATEHINTPDKLYEYFLIDVEMDPCTKTSRIRQAISTVQLFIQRCLMNLEQPGVSPASIKADQWEWMKRYRVWEANRKVFLYPENWLESELRDNKSPFFRDLESELLQADITDELAETAFLKYLEKLDEVSKLEICGMYLQEEDIGNKLDDILHVFGRTTGASRKYYYRRLDHGYWTPWEKVDLDIEDNPILPMVWNKRLFLFWLNIVKKGSSKGPFHETTPPGELTKNDLNTTPKETIEINLSWSEYFNNKWQSRKTSDFNKPIVFGDLELGIFKREDISIASMIDRSGLVFFIESPQYYSEQANYFKLFNKHSTPLQNLGLEYAGPFDGLGYSPTISIDEWFSGSIRRFNYDISELFIVYAYLKPGFHGDALERFGEFEQTVLKKINLHSIVETRHSVIDIFESPFFYQDGRHVFFVEPEKSITTLPEQKDYGTALKPGIEERSTIPPKAIRLDIDSDVLAAAKQPDVGPGLKKMIEHIKESSSLNKVILDEKPVKFGDVRIDPIGSKHANILNKNMFEKSNFEMINKKEVL